MKRLLTAALTALLVSPLANAAADSNANSMSDAWERRFNQGQLLAPSILPAGDADGDGVSNHDECLAGTDLFDGTPPLGFLQANVRHVSASYSIPEGGGAPVLDSPEAYVISWPAEYGKLYSLQCSLDLSPQSWLTVEGPEFGYGEEIQVATLPTYQDGTVADKFFWRVAVTDTDTDGDGFTDHDEYIKGTNIWVADRDDDGLPDDWETGNDLDPDDNGSVNLDNGADGDPDGDLLLNIYEYWYDTDPRNPDTDADGLTDYEEIFFSYTNPGNDDSDNDGTPDGEEDEDRDGLTNLAELRTHHTELWNADTDNDTLRDGWEIANGLDPLVYNSSTDPDGDGLINAQEQRLGLAPLDSDTDDDGTPDGEEDPDGDDLTNLAEFNIHHTDPLKADTDNDDLTDGAEVNTHLTNPNKHDTDSDGLPDGWEILHSLNPQDATGLNGAAGDPDSDGLENFREWLNGCDPHDADSDDDGTDDLTEVTQGSDPNDPGDGGDPPPATEMLDVPFTVSDPSDSHSEKWKLTITGLGPDDHRTISLASPGYGQQATKSFKLRKSNRYETSISHLGTDPEYLEDNDDQSDYDWEATVDGKPASVSVEHTGEQTGGNNFFVVKDHWLVDNRQPVFTTEKHGDDEDIVSGKKAILVPVAIKDNTPATGVDDVSITADPQDTGYQEKFWIMAPAGTVPNSSPAADCENDMHFKIPLDPAADLKIASLNVKPNPTTLALSAATPLPTVTWHGTTDETVPDATTYKIGPVEQEVDLPVRVKAMKNRTVKVGVYPVTQYAWSPDFLPDKAALVTRLQQTFAFQVNAWVDVQYQPVVRIQFGANNRLLATEGVVDEEDNIVAQIEGRSDASAFDILVIMINDIDYGRVNPDNPALYDLIRGHTINSKSCVVCTGFHSSGNSTDPIATTTHEIGHIMVQDQEHPDNDVGIAPLVGTDRTQRLMCSGDNRAPGAKLLVKAEWDKIQDWLKSRPRGDN